MKHETLLCDEEQIATFFASPKRSQQFDLSREIETIHRSPVITGLLNSVSGLLAILNEHRQVLAVNDSFIKTLGIDDPKQALGLRPGEVLHCIYSDEKPAGCGTTRHCSTCGAAIAMVTCLEQDCATEKTCAITTRKNSSLIDLALLVKAQIIKIEEEKFILLFIQDISKEEQRAALERTFFHDISNLLQVILQASEFMAETQPSHLSNTIFNVAQRLSQEVAIQRSLSLTECKKYQPILSDYEIADIFRDLYCFFGDHPTRFNKKIDFSNDYPQLSINTDISLIQRIICNMILNALEATEKDGKIKVWVEQNNGSIDFFVWNLQAIPEAIQDRIFQRNFSTKAQSGRGIGTYSMKFFGENILRGKVSFTSSEHDGTTFCFSHPLT